MRWPGADGGDHPDASGKRSATEAALLVDANSGFSPKRAIEVGRMLEDNGIEHFEEPCLYWELEQTKEVTDALDIAGDRRRAGLRDPDMAPYDRHARRSTSCSRTSSISAASAAPFASAGWRRLPGLPITPQQPPISALSRLFTMHLLRAIEGAGQISGILDRRRRLLSLAGGLFVEIPLMMSREGQVAVSDKPGWGVEVDPEWLAKSRYQMSERA